jgi:hypothetical protein
MQDVILGDVCLHGEILSMIGRGFPGNRAKLVLMTLDLR